MKMFRHLALAAVLALGASAVFSQNLSKGIESAQSGNFAEAAKQFLPLAITGNAEAQAWLGALYKEGKGVDQDFAEAEKWLRSSAVQGNSKAQMMLGILYGAGLGMKVDEEAAFMWLSISVINGEDQALQGINKIKNKLTAEEIGRVRASVIRCIESTYRDCSE